MMRRLRRCLPLTAHLSIIHNWLDGQPQVPVARPDAAEIIHAQGLGAVLVLAPDLWHSLARASQVERGKRLLWAAPARHAVCQASAEAHQELAGACQCFACPTQSRVCRTECAWLNGRPEPPSDKNNAASATRPPSCHALRPDLRKMRPLHAGSNVRCSCTCTACSGCAVYSGSPIKVGRVLRQGSIGARALWAPAVAAQGCAVRLDGACRGGQPGHQTAVEAFEGSQSRVLGRCLRQSHSIHLLPSLHALGQGRDITCHVQGAT